MMSNELNRRDFLRLSSLGIGVVFASRLGLSPESAIAAGYNPNKTSESTEFYFLQMSDVHWGFTGDQVNPDSKGTLLKAIDAVNALQQQPDFIFFTGDLTHTTDDPKERRARMAEFKEMVSGLKVKNLMFTPGEHDASLDNGTAYQEYFGETHYNFQHKGVQFIVLDNVSDPRASIGIEQLDWLKSVLAKFDKNQKIVVFTHRPLFDLYPEWDWATRDGSQAIELLMPYNDVTVFYGHIHQENHHMTGHIPHHSAKSLMFPLPAPGSQPKRTPVPWNPGEPYKGLGFREVELGSKDSVASITEFPIVKG
jgi:3',5'-cyclic AMP phosphodiesterase CpdA